MRLVSELRETSLILTVKESYIIEQRHCEFAILEELILKGLVQKQINYQIELIRVLKHQTMSGFGN